MSARLFIQTYLISTGPCRKLGQSGAYSRNKFGRQDAFQVRLDVKKRSAVKR